jgi:hypothetical protein
VLALCLISSSTPAAAQTTVTLVQDSKMSIWLWYHSSGLAKLFQGQRGDRGREQEKQRDRDER